MQQYILNKMKSNTQHDIGLLPIDYDFMKEAQKAATSSGCIYSNIRFGAIAVRDNKVLSVGSNGAVGKTPPCSSHGRCIRSKQQIPSGTQRESAYCICAEQLLICNAARDGISLNGSTLYVTGLPCAVCIRLLVASGFVRVIYIEKQLDDWALETARMVGLQLTPMKL